MIEQKPWLSLPDEDPPERGLAELMAAARMKAEVMANPPWWKRLFAVMRRPPVLALATVVLVVCGVIVVGHDHDQAMTPAPSVDTPAGSLDLRARGTVPESPPPQAPPVVETRHEQPRLEKLATPQVNDTKAAADETLGGDQQAARYETETLDQAEATKAPEVRKAGLKAPDPLARCREAAARHDCAAAKACVKQAGRVDLGDDAVLKACL